MKQNEFQNFVIDVFCNTIQMCKQQNISRTVFLAGADALKGLVNHYASKYRNKDSYENLWQNSKFEYFSPLLMSENAFRICEGRQGSYKKYKAEHKGIEEQLLYWEHITPNDVIWKRILTVFDAYMAETFTDAHILQKNIADCFLGHRLLLITQEEQTKLDGKGGRTGKNISGCNDCENRLNVAEKRIRFLFTNCDVNSLYLNGTLLNQSDIFDEHGHFTETVKSYFTNDCFVINSLK